MNYYKEIKNRILDNEIYERVKDCSKERHRVLTYFEIGRLLHEAGKHYGESIISKYVVLLEKDFGKKYNKRVLFEMRQFYLLYNESKWLSPEEYLSKTLYSKEILEQKVPSLGLSSIKPSYNKGFLEQKVPSLVSMDQKVASSNITTLAYPSIFNKLTWTHFKYLITIKNDYERNYYTDLAIVDRLSVRELLSRIKSKEYYRLDEKTRNKLIKIEETNVTDFIKNPILIRNNNRYSDISEKALQTLILEDLPSFLNELGDGFSFVGNEYKIKLGDRFNYIDLLLFNIEYNCYIVIELKTTELKKEHVGQIELYMNYIDKNIKKDLHDKTIGIIICKKDNGFVIEYCSDKRIISREYKLIN